jgi:hypothetical protein
MGHARKAALHLLNHDWSRAVWKHWLSNIFLPPVDPPMPAESAAPSTSDVVNTAPPAEVLRTRLQSCRGDTVSEAPDWAGTPEGRRSELRARFESLSDRLGAVELGLDTLLRRTANVARLEQTLARLEDGLQRVERALAERQRRDSHLPAHGSQPPRSPSQYPESVLAVRERSPGSVRPSELDELEAHETSGIHGLLSEVSLSTVLAMLEIERHAGRLKIATDDGLLASFELSEGSVVSSRLSENDADPLHTLRTALGWKHGRFWFRQQAATPACFPPRSIGSLLLEATHQNDESFANVG